MFLFRDPLYEIIYNYAEKKGRNLTGDWAVEMTLDAPKISCQTGSYFLRIFTTDVGCCQKPKKLNLIFADLTYLHTSVLTSLIGVSPASGHEVSTVEDIVHISKELLFSDKSSLNSPDVVRSLKLGNVWVLYS